MAHALLANVSPINGLYTALISTFIYGFMGTSKWLSVGTGALPALLYGEALKNLDLSEDETGNAGSLLTFYIAIVTVVMFFLRLDELVVFISPSVLSAFTSTSAFLIATSQVKYLFGIHIDASGFVQTYVELFEHISETNTVTLGLGLSSIAFLLLCKKFAAVVLSKYRIPDPGAMLLVGISVILVLELDLESEYGVEVVGYVQQGFPPPILPWAGVSSPELHLKVLVQALIIAIINFVLLIAIAKNFALKSNSNLQVKQELKALASINTVGAFFGTIVAGGSFSGSAILANLKAASLVHNFVNSGVTLLILLALTSVVELIPRCTLAAIIIAAVPSLVNFSTPKELWAVKKQDFFLWVATFFITLFAGVQWGIISGTVLSLLVLVYRFSSSQVTELGILPGTTIYRSLSRFPETKRIRGIRMFRVDTSLSFANFEKIEAQLFEWLHGVVEIDSADVEVLDEVVVVTQSSVLNKSLFSAPSNRISNNESFASTFILSCEAVNDIDTAAIEMLRRVHSRCKEKNVRLLFSGFKVLVRETLYAAHIGFQSANKKADENIPAPFDPNCWFLNLNDAVLNICYRNIWRANQVGLQIHVDDGESDICATTEVLANGSPRAWQVSKITQSDPHQVAEDLEN